MAEHADPARKAAEPAGSAKPAAERGPRGELPIQRTEALARYAERLAPRGETMLGRCAQLLARRAAADGRAAPVQAAGAQMVQPVANRTGLPDRLKAGVEALSGMAMDNVRVHRNSPEPAKLGAHAYAKGTDIHLASGQERHLPHEAWHVVQQQQGRVKPTMQMKGGTPVNDDPALEREADEMGRRASGSAGNPGSASSASASPGASVQRQTVVQRLVSPQLRDMKRYRDSIENRVPAAYASRLAIVADVPALAAAAQTWTAERAAATTLWGHWEATYVEEEAEREPNPPARDLAADTAAMEQHLARFRPVSEHLIDHGLLAAKLALAAEYYFTHAPVNLLNMGNLEPDETLPHLKARLRDMVRPIAIPTNAGWWNAAGYAFNANGFSVRQLAPFGPIGVHWNVNRAQMAGVAALRTSDPIGTIESTLIPNGAGPFGVHVTLERYGADSPNNPKAFGRPAARAYNEGNLPGPPNAVTTNDLFTRLNTENIRIRNALNTFITAQQARYRLTWETH